MFIVPSTMKTRFLGVVCCGLLTAEAVFAQVLQPEPEWQSLKIQQTVNPIFPLHLQ